MGLLDVLIWILVGGIAGWVASLIMKTDAQMGAFANVVVGILGAFLGGWVVSLFTTAPAAGQLNIMSMLVAVLGAVILLWLVKLFRGRSTTV